MILSHYTLHQHLSDRNLFLNACRAPTGEEERPPQTLDELVHATDAPIEQRVGAVVDCMIQKFPG